MIPGEMLIKEGEIELNPGRETVTLSVTNSGDWPEAFSRGAFRGKYRGPAKKNLRASPDP